MTDIPDRLDDKRKDFQWVPDVRYKVRNLIKMNKGDNPYYPDMGLDKNAFFRSHLNAEVIKIMIARYLESQSCLVSGLHFVLDPLETEILALRVTVPNGETFEMEDNIVREILDYE